jgi:hypothetical protein
MLVNTPGKLAKIEVISNCSKGEWIVNDIKGKEKDKLEYLLNKT